jgi:carboxymethylenebutenolidase
MSGRYVVAVAAAYPDEIAFAASFYGVRIVDNHEQSAHLSLPMVKAHLYLAFAEFDAYVSDESKAQLLAILDSIGTDYQAETYAGTHHGFVFPERALYNADAASRHWATLVGLCEKHLGPAERS